MEFQLFPVTSCVTFAKLLNLSDPYLLICKMMMILIVTVSWEMLSEVGEILCA